MEQSLLNPYNRKKTREVKVSGVTIGGDAPISIQSMTCTNTRDVAATLTQIKALEEAGCEIVRVAVPDEQSAMALLEIKKHCNIPLVADIHFDHRLAILAIENGVDKLRINPGNIGNMDNIKQVVLAAKKHKVPIRIGVNSGSLEKDIYNSHGGVTAQALVESALRHVAILESLEFYDIVIAIKSSNVPMTIKAYELLSSQVDYPLHVGITEAGTPYTGAIKSACGIGSILSRGVGDTIRISLTGDPVEEVRCAKALLSAMGLRRFGVEVISCPTCGRTEIDLVSLAKQVELLCENIQKPLTVAVMGCVVNGPGEAKEADLGIAGGKHCGIIFKKGQLVQKVDENNLLAAFKQELQTLCETEGS